MKVLIVHRYFWPENISLLPAMLKDYVKFHLEKGDKVEVITGSNTDYAKKRKQEFDKSDVIVHSLLLKQDRDGSMFIRLVNACRFYVFFLKKNSKDTDLMYCTSYPPFLAFLLIALTRFFNKKIKIIYIVQDIISYRIRFSIFKKIYSFFNKKTIRLSDATITLSTEMKDELSSYFNHFDESIYVLPNYSIASIASINDKLSEEKKWDVIYAGNHGEAQNLEFFLDVINDDNLTDNIKVSFFGNGTLKKTLIEKSVALGINNRVDFYDAIPYSDVIEKIKKSKFGLVSANEDLFRYAFPSKLLSYNSVGTQGLVMCEKNSKISTWIEDNSFGYQIDASDIKKCAMEINDKLIEFDKLSKDRCLSRRNEVIKNTQDVFGKKKYFTSLESIINSIIKR